MNKQEVLNLISEKIGQAEAIMLEAEAIADEAGVDFYMSLGGYGMGGHYKPNYGWVGSSQSC